MVCVCKRQRIGMPLIRMLAWRKYKHSHTTLAVRMAANGDVRATETAQKLHCQLKQITPCTVIWAIARSVHFIRFTFVFVCWCFRFYFSLTHHRRIGSIIIVKSTLGRLLHARTLPSRQWTRWWTIGHKMMYGSLSLPPPISPSKCVYVCNLRVLRLQIE